MPPRREPPRRPEIPLGAYDLLEPIGQGGMGQVWRAMHREERVPAAVKLLVRPPDAATAAAFRREVRAVAGLDHPNVVLVLDCGEVDAAATRASRGALRTGAPWLAMEYAEGGSISAWRGRLPWANLREILLELLDALAHAHARGVVHRDLKPANVLLGGLRPGAKLTDFGIAHLSHPGDGEEKATPAGGTPAYMAPEQIEGRWRDYGPWTDLYALGATAWALATGLPPFKEKGFAANARAHLARDPPAFRPREPVPHGFEEWLRRLLAKDPRARYRRAADAAWALEQLGEAGGQPSPGDVENDPPTSLTPTLPPVGIGRRTTLLWGETSSSELVAPAWVRSGAAADEAQVAAAPRPPLPSRWERPSPAVPLKTAALGLFGLRQVPVVGRRGERDALWVALREAAGGRPRGVVLSGAAGCGKSRLAEWLCERAHELGAAEVISAFHGPGGGPGAGLAPMIARALRSVGLPREEVRARLGRTLPPIGLGVEDVEALTELVCPASDAEREAGVRAPRLTGDERRALARRLVLAIAAERPAVLWADDLQWGGEVADLVRDLLDAAAPVLVLATVQEEALGDDRVATERVRALVQHPAVTPIEVRPLSPAVTTELVGGLLGLDDGLVDRVRRRVAGNPLFALQLVGDWVARGALVASDHGLVLREGFDAELPDDVHAVWRARVERVCDGLGRDAIRAVVLAACLGQEVDPAEWHAAAEHAGIAIPDPLADRLLDQRLWRPVPGASGLAFAHGMLRESLLRDARVLPALHRACAEMLASRRGPGVAARLGRHRLAAGQAEEAVRPLTQAAERAARDGDLREASDLLDLAATALDACEAPADDPRRGTVLAYVAEVTRARGDSVRARRAAEQVLAGPEVPAWQVARCRARALLAFLSMKAGDLDVTVRELGAAVEGLEAVGELALAARNRMVLAIAHQYRGDLEAADAVIATATARSTEVGDPAAIGEAYRMRGAIALQRGRLDDAVRYFEHARDTFDAAGHRGGRCLAEAGLGDAARFQGRLADAERLYGSAADGLEACGAASAWTGVRASLALVLMDRGEWAEARRALEQGVRQLERRGAVLEARDLFRFLALPCYAALRDWGAFDTVLEADRAPVVDADVARALDRAATLASEAGEPVRADRARRLAEQQWRVLKA